jgi:cytoskeletal protein RodZ
MESVGFKLREARNRLGLSLEEVNAATRISVKSLQALENDDLPGIGTPFFYKSFVKQYAGRLKLDYGQLLPAIESAVRELPEPLIPGQGDLPVPSRIVKPPRRRNLRWLYSVTSLVAVLIGCSALYAYWQTARNAARQGLTSLVSSSKIELPARPRVPDTAAPAPAPRTPPANQGDGTSGNRIELSAIEPTWLSVTTDGHPVFEGVLKPEETKVLEERHTARIRTGNAGGVSCVFNGKPIGTFGPRGQVRTVLFTKNNYQVLESPVHMTLTHFTFNGE